MPTKKAPTTKATPAKRAATTKAGGNVVSISKAKPASKAAPAKKATAAKAKPAEGTRGQRGEHLDRVGTELGEWAVARAYREFDLCRHLDVPGVAVHCRIHDTWMPEVATSMALAEEAGARQARKAWCPGCDGRPVTAANRVAPDEELPTSAERGALTDSVGADAKPAKAARKPRKMAAPKG